MRILKKEMVLSYKYINMRIYLLYLFEWHNPERVIFSSWSRRLIQNLSRNHQTRKKTLTRDTSESFQA